MTKSKFTPRPWVKTKTATGLPKIADKNGFAICHGKDYSKEADANFDLIAAAPELYKALSELLEAFRVINDCEVEWTQCENQPEFAIALQALAKARGEVNQPKGTNSQQ